MKNCYNCQYHTDHETEPQLITCNVEPEERKNLNHLDVCGLGGICPEFKMEDRKHD